MCTHQGYIEDVAALALSRLPEAERESVKAHITYGAGQPGLRGVTYYGAWTNGNNEPIPFVEVCAFGEESAVQLAGTTIHELAHVLAGFDAGHGRDWKKACARLGLRAAKAAGTTYKMAQFAPELRMAIGALNDPTDGSPVAAHHGPNTPTAGTAKPKACPLGVGTRGGKSRGKGSGSRLRKYVCGCTPKPQIIRASTDSLAAHCDCCGQPFSLA